MTKATEIKPRNDSEMVKPRELIEMTELVPLNLQDRRIFNLLVKHAWSDIEADKMHSIPKAELRLGMGSATERLGQTVKRIMAVVVERKHGRNGVERFHLLTHNIDDDEDDDGALFHYTFPAPLRKIIRKSEVWARLESHVVYAFSSKYALALYELVALRANLKHLTSEKFELEKFRDLLGVEKGKLREFKNLKSRAIDYAVREVNGLCPEFNISVSPVMTGRKVTGVEVSWWKKEKDEKRAALRELAASKIGRGERLAGTVEHLVQPPKLVTAYRPAFIGNSTTRLTGDDIDEARKLLNGHDIHYIEAKWQEGVRQIGVELDTAAHRRNHWLKFVEAYVRQHPKA